MTIKIRKAFGEPKMLLLSRGFHSPSVGVRLVLIMMEKSINPAPWALLWLLSSQWSDIKIMISRQENLSTSSKGGISMENVRATISIEDTETRLLAVQSVHNAVLFHGLLVIVVVLDGSDGLIHRNVEIVLESIGR